MWKDPWSIPFNNLLEIKNFIISSHYLKCNFYSINRCCTFLRKTEMHNGAPLSEIARLFYCKTKIAKIQNKCKIID